MVGMLLSTSLVKRTKGFSSIQKRARAVHRPEFSTAFFRMRPLSLFSLLFCCPRVELIIHNGLLDSTLASQQASHSNVLSVEACITRLEQE